MITLYIISFISFLILDFILNKYLFNTKLHNYYITYVYNYKFLFSIIFGLLVYYIYILFFNLLDLNLLYNFDFFNYMSDSENQKIEPEIKVTDNKSEVNVHANNANLNVESVNVSANIQSIKEGIQNLAAAASAVGGAKVALEVSKSVPGPVPVKMAAGLATYTAIQTTTVVVSKILTESDSKDSSSNITKNFLPEFNKTEPDNLTKFTDYPMNLLPEIDKFI